MKTKWIPNKKYPNTYFAKVNNYKEYFKLVKGLYNEVEIFYSYINTEWIEKEHLFNNDKESWYEFFDANCLDINYDNIDDIEDVDLVDPKEYDGDVRVKPKEFEYPVVVIFDGDLKNIMWQSLSDIE